MRYQRVFNKKLRTVFPTVISSAFFSCIVIVIIILVFGFLVSRIDATDIILSAMSTIALCIGAFCGGYISGKKRRKSGLLIGVLCGVFVFVFIVIASHFFAKAAESFSMPTKLIFTLLFAGAGGVAGVNSKSNRF